MSHDYDRLSRARTDLEQILRPVEHRKRRLDLARVHLKEWQSVAPPPWDRGPVGGSSSPAELEDRAAERQIASGITRDSQTLPDLVKRIERDCRQLQALVARWADPAVLDHAPPGPAGCRSCARIARRKGAQIGGHFAPVRESCPGHHLCDWCYRHALAVASMRDGSISREDWPPVQACDVFHRQGGQAAGRWLARRQVSNGPRNVRAITNHG